MRKVRMVAFLIFFLSLIIVFSQLYPIKGIYSMSGTNITMKVGAGGTKYPVSFRLGETARYND